MTETWAVVPGHPNHIVSTEGRVRHHRANAPILKGYVDADGYRRLRLDGRERRVHRLVCEAFNGAPPAGTECAHRDGNPLNNNASNLRWATYAENVADTIKLGRFQTPSFRGEKHPNAQLSDAQVAAIRASHLSSRAVAAEFGVSQSHVVRLRNGRCRNGIALNNPEKSS